jgi:hypothetical protein
MNEYERWLRDRELQQAAMGRVNPPAQRPATVEGDVLAPTLQALAVGICGGLVAGTVVLLFGFRSSGWTRLALALCSLLPFAWFCSLPSIGTGSRNP